MKVRFAGIIAAGFLAGCWPHETRPLTESEERWVERMCEAIAGHAERTKDPVDRAVSKAVDEAHRDGRISAFEDSRGPGGYSKQGAVVCGRLYLHSSILDGKERLDVATCPYGLLMLYHEGVHLTQSMCALLMAPASCEEEAEDEMRRFEATWERRRRNLSPR